MSKASIYIEQSLSIQKTSSLISSAGVNTAIFGGKFEDAFRDAMINSVTQSITTEIGGLSSAGILEEGGVGKALLHAATQCASAELKDGDCKSAAIGAAAAEFASPVANNAGDWGQIISQIAGGIASNASGGDFIAGFDSAGVVDSFNRRLHPNEKKIINQLAKKKALEDCGSDLSCIREKTQYWNEVLTQYSKGEVDSYDETKRNDFYKKLKIASENTLTDGYWTGEASNYLDNVQTVKEMLSPYKGKLIEETNIDQTYLIERTNGEQTYFSATEDQKNDRYLNWSIYNQDKDLEIRNQKLINSVYTINGSIEPVFPELDLIGLGAGKYFEIFGVTSKFMNRNTFTCILYTSCLSVGVTDLVKEANPKKLEDIATAIKNAHKIKPGPPKNNIKIHQPH